MTNRKLTVNISVNSEIDAKKILEKLYAEIAKEIEVKVEVAKEDEPLKVGDYVKVVEFINDNRNYTKFTEIGDVVKIDRLDGGGRVDYTILRNGKQGSVVAYYKFTKATDEEVVGVNRKQAEDERWSSIGRKPGKFKKGDIVKGRSNLGSGEVIIGENKGLVDSNGHFAIASSNNDGYRIVRDIELITPVEARFDR